jgi:outer membrane protein OmpA-like peptidoglycan-associated protein
MSKSTIMRRFIPIIALIFLGAGLAAVIPQFLDRGTELPEIATAPPEPVAPTQPPAIDPPEAPVEPQVDPAAIEGRLTEMQSSIARLADDVATLGEHQVQIDAALAQQADLIEQISQLPQEAQETKEAKAPAEEPLDRDALAEDLEDIGATPTEDGHLLTLDESDIRFDSGQEDLSPEQQEALRAIADLLLRYEHLQARIAVHTDNTGIAARNLELSQARARSVQTALAAMGVDSDRLDAEGFGDTIPINHNRTVASRKRNRRVEIYLIEPDPVPEAISSAVQ